MRKSLTLAVMLYMCLMALAARCQVYVDAGAPATGQTGKSWATAFTTITAALNSMPSGGTVWIKAGVYQEHLTLPNATSLYGGFLGYEISLTQRELGISATVLDAGQAGPGIYVPQNDYAKIDGFTIINGLAANGGGIDCENTSTVGIHNCCIQDCQAQANGGGIYFSNYVDDNTGDRTITNCVITNNIAPNGGGLYIGYHCYPTITGCVITGNQATVGGGLNLPFHSGANLVNCTVAYNVADSVAGAVYSYYGGPHEISECIFAFNSAPVSGGFWGDDEGKPGNLTSTTITNCDLFSNSGGDWGGNIPDPGPSANNLFVDPMFLMPGDGAYNLTIGSPCAGMGAYPLGSTYSLGSIGVAKLLGDGNSVTLQGKIVSCVDSNTIYLQEPGRFSGIAVQGTTGYAQGQILSSVIGTLSTDSSGCRLLTATSSTLLTGAKWSFAPLGTRISWLAPLTGVYTRTWGRVENPSSSGFTLVDGKSSVQVRYSGAEPAAGDYAIVTGVRTNDGSVLATKATIAVQN